MDPFSNLSEEMLLEICNNMDLSALGNFVRTSNRTQRVCGEIISDRKEKFMNSIKHSDNHEVIIEKVKYKLEKLQKESKPEYKLYFSGEGDSNQTKFEKKSNNLEITILSNDSTVGFCLLHLLRIIIDDNPNLLENIFEMMGKEDVSTDVSTDEYIEELAKQETTYSDIFESNKSPIRTLTGYRDEQIIKKEIYEIDIWNFKRVFDEIGDHLE